MSNEPDIGELAKSVLSETVSTYALRSTELPQAVRDATEDMQAAITDVISAGDVARGELDEVERNRNMIPDAGLRQLRLEAQERARERARDNAGRAERAEAALREALTDAALPRLDRSRETLARQELTTAIGDASGEQARARAVQVAQSGSPEVVAALFSSYGKTLLEARGVTGRELADTTATARALAAAQAVERGETVREIMAGKALAALPRLGAVRSMAQSHVSKVVGS